MSSQVNFKDLLETVKKDYSEVRFIKADTFYWSPKDKIVYYNPQKHEANWSLLHELSHALLDHTSYESDFELLLLEVAAWEKAKNLSKKYYVEIDSEHIQDCLDTYRDWLYRRSECTTCQMRGLQITPTSYECTNCLSGWKVSVARFCRPYRRRIIENKNRPLKERAV